MSCHETNPAFTGAVFRQHNPRRALEAGPPTVPMPLLVASTHCPLLRHPASDRDSKPGWHWSHLSPITPGLQLHRPSLSHCGLREPAERPEGEAGVGTFPPKSLCEFVIISEGRWVLKSAVWCVGAQSLTRPGARQVPQAPLPQPCTYPRGGRGRAGSTAVPAGGRSRPCSARSARPPCGPGSPGSGTRSPSPAGAASQRRIAWTSHCSHTLGRGEQRDTSDDA